MKKIYLLSVILLALLSRSFAQVTITGSTGANGTYTSLTQAGGAFATLNGAGSQAGNNIIITLTADVATEDGANQLAGNGWTTLTINPSGGVARTMSGSVNGPLISLNGAANVTIDGLNSGGNILTFSNTNTGSSASTLRFINDASNNTITRCNLLGSTGASISGFGIIYFAAGVTTGNDNNTISQCNLSAAGGNFPLNAIYSFGTSSAIDNSGNTITVNNIADYYNTGLASNGININSGNSGWTITNNALYQTATRTFTSANTHNGIFITSGSGYTISNNVIGYAAPNATGTTNMIGLNSGSLGGTFPSSFTAGGAANATRYNAINCAFTAGGTVSSIQNNTIGGIALYTSSGANTTFGVICGIAVTSGNANIGTVTGNTIGSASGINSLYAVSTTAGAVISGIYVTSTNTVDVQNNIVGGINVSGTSISTAAGFKGIEIAGAGTHTASNNIIGSSVANNIKTGYLLNAGNLSNTPTGFTSASGTATVQGIVSNVTGASANLNNNIVRGIQIGGSATTFYGVRSQVPATTVSINNNQLGTSSIGLVTIMFANSAGILCSANEGTGTSTNATINNNTFQGVTYMAEGSGSFRCISASGTMLSYTANNNNFNNLTVNTSGSTQGFLIGATNNTPTVTISGNYITSQFTNITTTGTPNWLAIACNAGTPATGSTTITNNNISNITYRSTTSFGAGIYWVNGNVAGTTHNITVSNNVFSNIYNQGIASTAGNFGMLIGMGNNNTISGNTISGIYGKAAVAGLQTNANSLNAAGVFNVFNNRFYDIVTSGSGSTAYGLQSTGGPASNLYQNKIFDIRSLGGGTVVGLLEGQGTAGTIANVHHNLIGRLYAPNNAFVNGVTGIYMSATVVNTKNFYYNTVYLDGSCPSQSYCLFTNSNTPTINLRNNLFINNITATGGSTLPSMVYFRSGTSSLGSYATTSNNNIFYAGTPGSSNIIYADGTVGALTNIHQTLATFQAFATPREANTFTELSPFLNTTNGLGSQYLHLNPAIATLAESGAVNIATYTTDYDNEIRQGNGGYTGTGTAPDIGADEIEVSVDKVGPDISYTPLTNTTCVTNPTLTATIADASGINATAGTKPRIYFKAFTNSNSLGGTNDNTTNGWKYVEASNASNPYSFTIDYSLVFGGVAAGTTIQYFVTAQDLAGTPNVAINSGAFAATPSSVALTGAAFAISGLINSYEIRTSIPASITIGAAGTYTSLTGINGLFADINNKGLSANTVVNIIDASVAESGLYALNQIANGCGLGNYTLTVKPNAAGTILTGSIANQPLLKIRSNNVIIDGSSNGSTSRDLTITNTSAIGPTVILFGSTGTTPITNSTLKNCTITNGSTSVSAIAVGDGLTTFTPGYFNNITIQNNDIGRAYMGIYTTAVASSGNGIGLNISNNALNTSGANNIRYTGIYVQGVDGATISGNDIGNFETNTSEVDRGIWLATGTSNAVVEKNNIHDIRYTGVSGYGGKGIVISSGLAAANISVRNNMIYGITGDGDSYSANGAFFCPVGIYAFGTGQGGINIYYNSIYLSGSTLNFAADVYSIGIALDENTAATIKDNIIKNELGLLGAIGIGAVGIAAETAASQFTSLDYNDYYSQAPLGTSLIGKIGATDYATLAAWQTATAQEANSLNVNPNFTSATDLHLVPSTNCRLDGYGTPIAGITTDYDLQSRDAGAPDMGADEYTTTPAPSTMTSASNCDTKNVSPSGTLYIDGSCNLIARVLPSGGSAVNGKIRSCVTLDASPVTFNGEPYVQRHYDIEPETTPATATATVTLYFTDAEFMNYNTTYPAWPTLPTNGAGNTLANRGNVRITQFHGVGFGSPTAPGNYPGTRVLITPGAANVVWNGSFWEVTIPVTGFSGFYLHTTLTNAPLPVIVNYLTGRRQGSNHLLNWKVTCTTSPRATMTLERSSDSRNYSGLYTITADAARCNQPFDYTDANPLKGMNYYRLRIVDADGKITYSTTVALLNAVKGFDIISIAPNPVVSDNFKLNVASAQSGKMEISIFDMQGRIVNRQALSLIGGYNSIPVNVANLAPGTYTIKGSVDNDQSKVIRFVKQ